MDDRLRELISNLTSGRPINWLDARRRIFDLHESIASFDDRGACIGLFVATAALMERNLTGDDVAKFMAARQHDYNLFITRESLDGESLSIAKLDAVTEREVAAGRMARNHRLRVLAIFGSRGLAPFLDEHPDVYEALVEGGD